MISHLHTHLLVDSIELLTVMAGLSFSSAQIVLSAVVLLLLYPLATPMEELEVMAEEGGYYKREHSLVAPYQGEEVGTTGSFGICLSQIFV